MRATQVTSLYHPLLCLELTKQRDGLWGAPSLQAPLTLKEVLSSVGRKKLPADAPRFDGGLFDLLRVDVVSDAAPKRDACAFASRASEIRPLVIRAVGKRAAAAGVDIDDIVQEVALGLASRDRGKSPWSPERGALSTYVTLVANCVFSSYMDKYRRWAKDEPAGLGASHDEDGSLLYEPEIAPEVDGLPRLRGILARMAEGGSKDASLALRVLPLKYAGFNKQDICDRLDLSPKDVVRATQLIERVVTQ